MPAVADSGPDLDALGKLDPPQQKRAVALVESGQAQGIRAAKKLMRPSTVKPGTANDAARQKRRDDFARAWKALDDDDRRWARSLLAEPNDGALPLRSDYGVGSPGARSAGGGDTQEEAGVRSFTWSSSWIIVADAFPFVALAGVADALARCAAEACDIAG